MGDTAGAEDEIEWPTWLYFCPGCGSDLREYSPIGVSMWRDYEDGRARARVRCMECWEVLEIAHLERMPERDDSPPDFNRGVN